MKYVIALIKAQPAPAPLCSTRAAARYPWRNTLFHRYIPIRVGGARSQAILDTQYRALADAFEKSGVSPSDIAGIGITNQRDDPCLGPSHGKTRVQRNRLAVPAHSRPV
jgi:hypothetical protein